MVIIHNELTKEDFMLVEDEQGNPVYKKLPKTDNNVSITKTNNTGQNCKVSKTPTVPVASQTSTKPVELLEINLESFYRDENSTASSGVKKQRTKPSSPKVEE